MVRRIFWLALLFAPCAQAATLALKDTVPLFGHQDGMSWVAFTRNGTSLWSAGGSHLVQWDAPTGRPLQSFRPLDGQPFTVVGQAPDGAAFLLQETVPGRPPGQATRLVVFSTAAGQIRGATTVTHEPDAVCWNAAQTGVRVAEVQAGQTRVWTWQEGGPAAGRSQTLSVGGAVVAFADDCAALLVRSQGLTTFDLDRDQVRWTVRDTDLPSREDAAGAATAPQSEPLLSASPYGPRVLVRTAAGLALIDSSTGRFLAYLDPRYTQIGQVWWAPGGSVLMLATPGAFIHLVDVDTGKEEGVVDGGRVLSMPDRHSVWTETNEAFLHFDLASGLDLDRVEHPYLHGHPGEPKVVVDDTGRPLRWWALDAQGGGSSILSAAGRTELNEFFTVLTRVSPDGTLLANLGERSLQLLDARTREVRWSVATRADDVVFSPDGTQVALGESSARMLDVRTGAAVQRFQAEGPTAQTPASVKAWRPGPRGRNRSLAFSPDGQQLAIGYEASAIGLWNVAAGTLGRTLTGGRGWVLSVAYSPDGTRLVSGWGDGSLRFYDVRSGELTATRPVNQGFVRWVAYSPDGQQVAAATASGGVTLWTASGELLRRLPGHAEAVTTLGYLDARTLVTGDSGGTVRVWNVTTGQLLSSLNASGALIQSLAPFPDGHQLVSSDRDNALRFYEVSK